MLPILMPCRHVALLRRQPRRRPEQTARDVEQRLERPDEVVHHLLLRERVHERQAERVRVLVLRLVQPREDVLLEVLDRAARGGEELREGLACAEGVLAGEEGDADAGDLGGARDRCEWLDPQGGAGWGGLTNSRRSLKTSATHTLRGMFSRILRRPVMRSRMFWRTVTTRR